MDDYDGEFNGMSGSERETLLAQRKKRRIITAVVIGVIILAFIVAIIGLVIMVEKNDDDDANAPSDSSLSPSPSPITSPSSTPTNSAGTNNQDQDINTKYYQSVAIHPFTIDDLIRTDRIGEPVSSPNDTLVAFTRYVYNPSTNVSSTTMWIFDMETGVQRQLTPFGWSISESNPCWSPDSSALLFISNRNPQNIYWPGETSQVWQIKVAGNELPAPLTDYPMPVNDLMCSNTGAYIAFAANVVPGHSLSESADIISQKEDETVRAFTFDKLFIRHWGEWYHGERSHVFLQAIEWASSVCTVSGAPMDMLGSLDADVPTKPFGGIEEWSFSPDDTQFAFTRRYDETSEVAWTTNLDIFTVQIEQGIPQSPICITQDNLAADTQPSYSPDGTKIAYLSQNVPAYESARVLLKIFNVSTQTVQTITEDWDRSIDSLVWLPDSSGFYVTVGEHAMEKIFLLNLDGGYSAVVSEHTASSLNVLASKDIIFSYESMMEPAAIYKSTETGQLTKLTSFNEDMLNKTYRSAPTEFWFEGAYEEQVHAWVLNATLDSVSGNPSQYPVAFLIHGGPQSSWSDDWSYRWNPQTYAGNGYAVVMIDFHGSTGYGQNFTDSITNNYGGAPFYDLNTGLDLIISSFPFIDGSRQVALGASYGGWMINWINGHQWNNEDRFLCLVCHDGIFDEQFFWFDTEELWFPEHDMVGTPKNNSNYNTWNPALFSDLWNTPQLVIHGGRDYRIPDSHGIGAFTALQRRGIESKFMFFPTENHWVLTPSNSVYWHRTVNDWIDSFAYPQGK